MATVYWWFINQKNPLVIRQTTLLQFLLSIIFHYSQAKSFTSQVAHGAGAYLQFLLC